MSKLYTLGHSIRSITEFLDILKFFKITQVIDVRSVPKSRHNPQYNMENLSKILEENQIIYIYMKGLGGFRTLAKNDLNNGWENKSFRSYADYMQTTEFKENLEVLVKKIKHRNTAIMCAEILPWRCHRSLIADALTIRGFVVEDIITTKNYSFHKLTKFAKIDGENITYPAYSVKSQNA